MKVDHESLVELGLSLRESRAYLLLLQTGESTVASLSHLTGEQRSNTYDTLSTLQKKGLVSFVIKKNSRMYLANPPENLREFFQEKERRLLDLLPLLQAQKKQLINKPIIEVYEGVDGARFVYEQSVMESIRKGQEIVAFGAHQRKGREMNPEFHKRLYQRKAKHKVKTRLIITSDEKPILEPFTQIRVLPNGFESPVATYIYGDRVSFWLFLLSPTIIVVEHKEFAQSYRNHFEVLWRASKKYAPK